jgi:hypothetical protein
MEVFLYGACGRIRTSDRLVRSQVLYPAELHTRKLFYFRVLPPKVTHLKEVARVEGFEPPTAWFVARYSIQLSYTRAIKLLLTVTPSTNNGGEGGIRTLDTSIRYGSLAGNWFQPLTHLSLSGAAFYGFTGRSQTFFR